MGCIACLLACLSMKGSGRLEKKREKGKGKGKGERGKPEKKSENIER